MTEWGHMGDSVLAAVLLSSYDAGFLLAFSLTAIPYATAFTDELEYNYAKYGTIKLLHSKTGEIEEDTNRYIFV